ncbi:MAG: hypothetical protein LBK69_02120 [Syntrophomonadaceae bacterium]|jgi:hypothetical protein|nr:hypothetical protein [Syntrophomonadaceae bacterium]
MKKIVSGIALSLALLAALPLTAFAHGGGAVSQTALCAVENCNIAGSHYHDGVLCGGHYIGDGHDYHQICTVKNCTKNGNHTHNGVECLPHTNNGGYGCHKSGGHH